MEGIDFVPNNQFGVIRCSVRKQEGKILESKDRERGEEESLSFSFSLVLGSDPACSTRIQ